MRSPSAGLFTTLNHASAALMGVAAVLQYNDPDPLPWLSFYAAAALACIQSGRWKRDWIVPGLVGAIGFVWAITLTPGAAELRPTDLARAMHEKGGAVEIAREVGGLALATGWMAVLVVAGSTCRTNRCSRRPRSR